MGSLLEKMFSNIKFSNNKINHPKESNKVSSPALLEYPSSPRETDGVCTMPGRSPALGFARPREEVSSVKNTLLLVSTTNVTEVAV